VNAINCIRDKNEDTDNSHRASLGKNAMEERNAIFALHNTRNLKVIKEKINYANEQFGSSEKLVIMVNSNNNLLIVD
jgi:hypothetical protein